MPVLIVLRFFTPRCEPKDGATRAARKRGGEGHAKMGRQGPYEDGETRGVKTGPSQRAYRPACAVHAHTCISRPACIYLNSNMISRSCSGREISVCVCITNLPFLSTSAPGAPSDVCTATSEVTGESETPLPSLGSSKSRGEVLLPYGSTAFSLRWRVDVVNHPRPQQC